MRLKLNEFFEMIENEQENYIVRLGYKYCWEEDFTVSNELLEWEYDTRDYVWLNDWYEGQDFVYVIGFIKVSDVDVPEYRKDEK